MVKITEELVRKKSEHNELMIGTLEELSLHQEDIEKIEHLHNWCRDLKILLLQSNLISKIENLYKLKKLVYLNLAINNIERIENLEALESLQKLDLTLNFIGELTSVENLCNNYNLRELYLTGNPCSDYAHYRDYVIAVLPQLDSFDCKEVSSTDKLLAKKCLVQHRASIVQHQIQYAIERDEQKLRVQEQKQEMEVRMSQLKDEDEKIKLFWESKSEHCPEVRAEMARYQKLARDKKESTTSICGSSDEKKKPITLFAACGRPYNLNQAKLPFKFQDETNEYILELEVYKYLDTSLINVEVEPNYIRATVKGKIFQVSLLDEVQTTAAQIQRSQTTGFLLIKVPKLHSKELLTFSNKKKSDKTMEAKPLLQQRVDLQGTVDIRNITKFPADLPELV